MLRTLEVERLILAGTSTNWAIESTARELPGLALTADEASSLVAPLAGLAQLVQEIEKVPLHGVTVGVKDIVDMAGAPTTGGSRTLGKRIASRDARCVARLRAAGAIVLGKLHTHELAAGATSENELHGRARNPWNMDYIPGGSSGGSAAATAARLVHGALGMDTGGSVPAGFSAEGLPIGLQIIGRPFDEATILRVAHTYERATPWHAMKPSLRN